ncbi:hypothetical protein PI124_g19495 [Phytophthora idaei]|nr:hypothetical protein PI124_g19495 [Phytophthora idaei]
MKFTTIVRAGVFISALAATLTRGYTFSETGDLSTNSATQESTGLTVNEESRIYGGSEADASKCPYIVSLRKDEADGSTYCGGTLIASQYVVTAGHCVKTDENTIYASIGSAFGSGSGDGQQVKVVEGYRHPLYNKSEHLYDVGVIKLEKEVSTDTIDLCAADGSDNEVRSVATVRGWGLTENGSQSRVMEEVSVKIISNAECNKEYSDRITEAPTPAPTVTEAPGTDAPQTESPTTDSEDAYAPSTDSAEQKEPSSNPAQQSEPNATEAPTSASGIKTQRGKKDCSTLF